ncbi:unnamed protein product [[Candida] boidinii]|uniref:Oxidation resistance protein 1 n=1 Tax=Candida boidinii TaxID=5477 RepID=A0A9W6SYW0_CANBO|nr:hypothetical protein BVG19_g3689 [[Candida] boidinii]OWB52493.1 hypothetical protein B5S27_g4069 [[Candida] boidinii]OWB69791.1 hypothetical protein B5S30_g5223 [[Candida] boidinii]OWB86802.1 hypothetical protein B5S33_g5516 [[Candida] boidinii]GME68984.1 unnamed protein product [[Candida] boidinii]
MSGVENKKSFRERASSRIKKVLSSRPSSPVNKSDMRTNNNDNDNDNNDNNNITPSLSDISYDEPPLTPLELKGYKDTTYHRLLDINLAEELRLHLPPVLQIVHDWKLLYSLEQNGSSLRTLYDCAIPRDSNELSRRQGYLLIIMDQFHDIFGCYVNEYFRIRDRRSYYGNGDCFLWKSEISEIPNLTKQQDKNDNNNNNNNNNNSNDKDDSDKDINETNEKQLRLKVFPYTSFNDFIIYSNSKFISVGSGDGKFGLWIDENLNEGASDPVETFGNEPLSKKEKFNILALELWKIS